ncbi:hypothetical protein TraAM80_09824 [Trypanosoma rangeli]|uniref:Uncharacterized protein n=1 Tax=Trypanosoma rangeli TaxID=5698 RepID=A0A3R7JW28_TRYRA|nr:uncharacterized protein TraAM80_09824 [Trypanosoma rangeli]RNE96378.1 hypothetical protein TraAM80_09824 [Trypanosoma rangeli]|eukprot:RNE96378.1 hypothetical protein TraAM80_09824 [Trypanosoma rangeli]
MQPKACYGLVSMGPLPRASAPNARPPAKKGCARMGAPTSFLLGLLAAKVQSRGPKAGCRGAPQVSRERGGEGLVYTGPRRAAGKEARHPADRVQIRLALFDCGEYKTATI